MIRGYRLDWWLPLAAEPGEWQGRWDLATDAATARAIAMRALDRGAASGLVLIAALDARNDRICRVVADVEAVSAWSTDVAGLPPSQADQTALPPLGREDMRGVTLAACRNALLPARDTELIDAAIVTALVDIMQQAFAGTGPAVELAALIAGRVMPGCDR